MLKTIFFDLGNVLVFFSRPKMFRQVAECTGLSPDAARKILIDEKIQDFYEMGQIDTAHLIHIFKSRSPKPFVPRALLDALSDIFTPNTTLFPLIEQLHKQKLRLILLSNTSECHYNRVHADYPVLSLFDDFVLSYQVGVLKPSPQIFFHALSKARCDPTECFYTDDLPEFVEGARKVGLDSEVFIGVAALKASLAARGVS
jgi:glucose-1-phosphatase